MKPLALEKLISELSKLPTITKKSAEKIAFYLLESNQNEIKILLDSIESVRFEIKKCKECGHICESDICSICSDMSRSKKLVIVEKSQDVFMFEKLKDFKYYYHVLGGLINLNNPEKSKDLLFTSTLKDRAKKYNEIIIALSPNLDGIVTSNYIKSFFDGMKVTQLAQGIPIGAALEYVDDLTLKLSLENRNEDK